jgi:hypothetical protein
MSRDARPARDPGQAHEVPEADRKPRHGHQTEPGEVHEKAADLGDDVRRSRKQRY